MGSAEVFKSASEAEIEMYKTLGDKGLRSYAKYAGDQSRWSCWPGLGFDEVVSFERHVDARPVEADDDVAGQVNDGDAALL
jgi:hypothetical protein